MGKIWLKAPDPTRKCCACDGKTGPCSSCCTCAPRFFYSVILSGVNKNPAINFNNNWVGDLNTTFTSGNTSGSNVNYVQIDMTLENQGLFDQISATKEVIFSVNLKSGTKITLQGTTTAKQSFLSYPGGGFNSALDGIISYSSFIPNQFLYSLSTPCGFLPIIEQDFDGLSDGVSPQNFNSIGGWSDALSIPQVAWGLDNRNPAGFSNPVYAYTRNNGRGTFPSNCQDFDISDLTFWDPRYGKLVFEPSQVSPGDTVGDAGLIAGFVLYRGPITPPPPTTSIETQTTLRLTRTVGLDQFNNKVWNASTPVIPPIPAVPATPAHTQGYYEISTYPDICDYINTWEGQSASDPLGTFVDDGTAISTTAYFYGVPMEITQNVVRPYKVVYQATGDYCVQFQFQMLVAPSQGGEYKLADETIDFSTLSLYNNYNIIVSGDKPFTLEKIKYSDSK